MHISGREDDLAYSNNFHRREKIKIPTPSGNKTMTSELCTGVAVANASALTGLGVVSVLSVLSVISVLSVLSVSSVSSVSAVSAVSEPTLNS
jgi:hypothetical protein